MTDVDRHDGAESDNEQLFDSVLEQLRAGTAREGINLEFKRQLPGTTEEQKDEFRKDVCAMANAFGGVIVFGVANDRSVLPINGETSDQAIRRLGQTLQSGIEPNDPTASFGVREMTGMEGYLLLIYVPASRRGPHRLRRKGEFPIRKDAYVSPMTYEELRNAFQSGGSRVAAAVRFREARIQELVKERSAHRPWRNQEILVQMFPVPWAENPEGVDVGIVRDRLVAEGSADEWFEGWRFNLDGLAAREGARADLKSAYLQLFRHGAVESCHSLESWGDRPVSGASLATACRSMIDDSIKVLSKVDIFREALLGVAVCNVEGKELVSSDPIIGRGGPKADRPHIILPLRRLEDVRGIKLDELVRPILDVIWQSFGHSRCDYYEAGAGGVFDVSRVHRDSSYDLDYGDGDDKLL
jgi:hypothetical protein